MPAGSVHIKPDGISFKPSVEMLEDFEESVPISPLRLDHPIPAQQGGYPARNVQTVLMLTGGSDTKTPSSLSPPPTQSRVQAKTSLVLEDHCLSRPQRLKFFLKPSGTCGPLGSLLAGKSSLPASDDIPGDASTSEPALLLRLSRSVVLSGPPQWGHPTGRDSAQTLEATSPNGSLALSEPLALSGWVCQASAWALKPLSPLGSPHGSTGSNSSVSSPRPRLPSQGADPPGSAAKPLSLGRPRLQGLPRPQLKGAFSWPQDESTSAWDFSCTQVNI